MQKHSVSIQGKIEDALEVITRQRVRVIGSGRTDAGVHAMGQVAHFTVFHDLDVYKVLRSLNGLLPSDIRIKELCSVPEDFHAQYNALSKTYYYHLWLDPVSSPFSCRYSYHVKRKLDIDLLRDATKFFVGERDFTSFANSAAEGNAAKNPVRTLYRLDIKEEENGIRLEFQSNGFLYKMVRNITGTLLDIAMRKRDVNDIPAIFSARDRKAASNTAPPHGLFLIEVEYTKTTL